MNDVRVLSSEYLGLLLLCSLSLILPIQSHCQVEDPMRVRLDTETFSPKFSQEFQPLANQVATLVDKLIPGKPKDYPDEGILCFDAPLAWDKTYPLGPAPITLAGPKLPLEPKQSKGGTIRVALSAVQPSNKWRLAFELSHELAHVKMGVRSDNYLDETFAVAVSFEVLRQLGFQGYLLMSEGMYLHQLPPQIQKAISSGQWSEVRDYWLSQAASEGDTIRDRPFQTLGALLLLRDRCPKWTDLFDISSHIMCPTEQGIGTFQICPPNLTKMKNFRREFKALGLMPRKAEGSLISKLVERQGN